MELVPGAIERIFIMKSNIKMKYVEMPLSVFASQYPHQYFDLVSKGMLPIDALFDSRYIVRVKLDGSGGSFEIGFASDEWAIS